MTALDRWLDAYRAALAAHFPEPSGAVYELRHVLDSLPFVAPETRGLHARRAWAVYQDEGETDEGRAAVLLTYILAAERKGWLS